MGISRSQFKYQSRKKEDPKVISEIIKIKEKNPRYGILRVKAMLSRRGFVVNKKKVSRILRTMDLLVRKRRKNKRRLFIPALRPFPQATRVNQIWAMDFVSVGLRTGEKLRCFTIIDIYTRQCPAIIISISMKFFLPVFSLEKLRVKGLTPEAIILDNGPEFNNHLMAQWSNENNISLHFIDPGEPTQNGFIESFNGKFRDECINQNRFKNLKEAKTKIEKWVKYYNEERPHSALDYLTPKEFANQRNSVLVEKTA